MFDANASHVNIGEKIFVEVHGISEQLTSKGIKPSDILLCEHVKKSGERNRVNEHSKLWLSLDSEAIDFYEDDEDGDFSWLVYSGRPDGNGFIRDHWKNKALSFLGGEWDTEKINKLNEVKG